MFTSFQDNICMSIYNNMVTIAQLVHEIARDITILTENDCVLKYHDDATANNLSDTWVCRVFTDTRHFRIRLVPVIPVIP